MTSIRRREDLAPHEAHNAPIHDQGGIYRTGSSGSSGQGSFGRLRSEPPPQSGAVAHPFDEEGVEVVLDHGGSKIVEESPPRGGSQDVFRGGHPVQRPRPVRAPRPPHAPPPPGASGSFGSYGPPPRGEPRGPYPNQVPHDPSNGSFEDGQYYRHQPSNYSPQVHYPPPGGYPNEDVNVISPNHKGDPRYSRPPPGPQGRQYYRYPPTSPVSRPSHSPPRSKHHPPPPSQVSNRRGDGPYAAAQRGQDQEAYHPDDGTFNAYAGDRPQPGLVTESSFDSEQYGSSHHSHYSSHHGSHPPTPAGGHYTSHPPTPQQSGDPHQQFYGDGSWHSFEGAPHGGPPPSFDDQRYYGYPPESPYYQEGGYLETPYPQYDGRPYTDDAFLQDQHPDYHEQPIVSPDDKKGKGGKDSKSQSGILLPKAASEVDFEVTKPPPEPVTPVGTTPVCSSLTEVNQDDVLCGRGGGTNSQIGNRRFRQLVQEFQPTYLLARRKEKPLLARTIVLIIRKRGGRFLKKNDDTGELFEVGDGKAEAKTSQALREGLDVRATKSAANTDKKKKKKGKGGQQEDESGQSPAAKGDSPESTPPEAPPSPPPMPRLQGDQVKSGVVHPHSPEALNFRKRRRMRSKEGASSAGCGVFQDKLFMDFCPPRADLGRTSSPTPDYQDPMDVNTPPRSNYSRDYEDDTVYSEHPQPAGCTDIAMMAMMGAATGSFCLGPSKWR